MSCHHGWCLLAVVAKDDGSVLAGGPGPGGAAQHAADQLRVRGEAGVIQQVNHLGVVPQPGVLLSNIILSTTHYL